MRFLLIREQADEGCPAGGDLAWEAFEAEDREAAIAMLREDAVKNEGERFGIAWYGNRTIKSATLVPVEAATTLDVSAWRAEREAWGSPERGALRADGQRVVWGFVPARGGSTRIPRKNLAVINGRSLVVRAIDAAFAGGCDRVVVSTDDDEIAAHAEPVATVHRDSGHWSMSQIEPRIAHWMRRADVAEGDVIVLLQPTSPFRRASTVRRCIELVRDHGCDSALAALVDVRRVVFSGRLRGLYDPGTDTDLAERVIWDRSLAHRPRSQDVPGVGVEAGSVYAFTAAHFRATRCRMGGREAIVRVPWLDAFEIDEPEQLEVARLLAPMADGRSE